MTNLDQMIAIALGPEQTNRQFAEESAERYRKEFADAARSLGCDVTQVRMCSERHDDSAWQSGIHYHVAPL